jgi:hypothetical protein
MNIKALRIKPTEGSPTVVLDKESKEFEISGFSLPEDAYSFYLPILEWMEVYSQQPLEETILKINLEYFNSSSAKQLVKIIHKLEDILKTGKTARVSWHYHKEDELMEMKGQELQSIVNVPFDYCAFD